MAVMFLSAGCSMRQKTAVKPSQAPVPLQTATEDGLIQQYDQQATAITSLNASVTMQLTAGSAYTGVIKQYHEVNGFILAQKPSTIRVIGQVPVVGKKIFDMESDGNTFRIFIPSQNQFVVGPANLERPSAKPIENLRPQHLIDAIFWQAIPPGCSCAARGSDGGERSYYVLTVVRRPEPSKTIDWEIAARSGLTAPI